MVFVCASRTGAPNSSFEIFAPIHIIAKGAHKLRCQKIDVIVVITHFRCIAQSSSYRIVSFKIVFKSRDKLHCVFEGEPEYYRLIACLNLVVGECVKNAEAEASPESDLLLSRLPDYISEHISESISMRDAARELGYEYHYFSALFHKSFSMNFKNFLNVFRFDIARRLLENKSVDIGDISEKCGFGSQRNFNRVFKSLAGVTPSEYRSGKR